MLGLISTRDSLRLDTRQKNHIDNSLDRSAPTPGALLQAADFQRQYATARHRPTPVCSTYNCHGLTFAARRTGISDPAVIQKILREDGYQIIADRSAVLPGDIAIYLNSSNNDLEHSGLVVEADSSGLLGLRILSKWGSAHEVIHNIGNCPYDATHVIFYRLMK